MAQLQFKGKQFVQNHHLTVKFHELVPKKEKSLAKKAGLNDNLIIHGDNLKALKALLPTYGGKVKCIFIDPPYNTGNEKWNYNDNVNSPMMQDWLGKVVDREDLTRHDKWLCMMTPRLKLLRELLSEDGFIFIAIDDNEVHRLRLLLEEIFGENNFIGTIAWKKTSGDNKPNFAFTHDNIVIYGKNNEELPRIELSKEQLRQYQNPDNDVRGLWAESDYRSKWTKSERKNLYYAIVNPNTKEKIFPDTFSKSNRVWGCAQETHEKNENDGLVWWGIDGKSREPKKKRFLSAHLGVNTRSVWLDAGSNDEASQEIKEIGLNFDNPKPVKLIKRIIELATDKDSIILDSFAGSGTTGHAVLDLNKEDGGNRKFILVEMEDYADSITAERVRRVIKRYSSPSLRAKRSNPDEQGEIASSAKPPRNDKVERLGGTFSYFELGKPIEMESILSGRNLPTYKELARYVFYTATGEEFDEKAIVEPNNFIGESKEYKIYLFYKPDIEYLKNTALTLDRAKALGPALAKAMAGKQYTGKKRLVFAPTKYLDQDHLDQLRIDFAQLPFEIYKLTE